MTGTNLAAISQAWPRSQHAAGQMKVVVGSQVHEGVVERVGVSAALSPCRIKQS